MIRVTTKKKKIFKNAFFCLEKETPKSKISCCVVPMLADRKDKPPFMAFTTLKHLLINIGAVRDFHSDKLHRAINSQKLAEKFLTHRSYTFSINGYPLDETHSDVVFSGIVVTVKTAYWEKTVAITII